MINSYYFDEDINRNSVNSLIDKLETLRGEVNLWFSSEGGHPASMRFLITYLNSRKEEITITLTNRLCSSATLLLTHFEGVLKKNELDFMLFHVFDRERHPLRKSDWIDSDRIQKQDFERNEKLAKIFREKKILTEKQIKKFLKGKDILIYRKGVNKIFKTRK